MKKKAIVVGGSNGIGLSIANILMSKGYDVIILDVEKPDGSCLEKTSYKYIKCDLLDFQEDMFNELARDMEIKLVMVTAGFGRVADFEYIHSAEIHSIMTVNSEAGIKIARCFYERIKSDEIFYFGIMASIAGLISSPMFSVYAASKAAVCRFIESVNIELEVSGTKNRILNVSPGSIQGTKFNGGENKPALTEHLAREIIKHLFNHDELYIPDYESVYKAVIENYQNDPHGYGVYSYEYKKRSSRVMNENRVRIGYLSGTFDLFHIGHLNILRLAKSQCDYLIVGVHSSGARKGKQTFISLEERKEIVNACKYVDRVVDAPDEDDDAWELYHYNKLFVGSDYKGTERFNRYEENLGEKGVKIVYFPYTKSTSSTQIRNAIVSITESDQKINSSK